MRARVLLTTLGAGVVAEGVVEEIAWELDDGSPLGVEAAGEVADSDGDRIELHCDEREWKPSPALSVLLFGATYGVKVVNQAQVNTSNTRK